MAGRKRTVTVDEFLGNIVEDIVKGSVKPSSKFAIKHGKSPDTGFGVRLGLRGSLDATLVEDVAQHRGFALKLTPGAVVNELGLDSSVGVNLGTDRGIDGHGAGKVHWWCEVAIGDTEGMAWIREIDSDDDGLSTDGGI